MIWRHHCAGRKHYQKSTNARTTDQGRRETSRWRLREIWMESTSPWWIMMMRVKVIPPLPRICHTENEREMIQILLLLSEHRKRYREEWIHPLVSLALSCCNYFTGLFYHLNHHEVWSKVQMSSMRFSWTGTVSVLASKSSCLGL